MLTLNCFRQKVLYLILANPTVVWKGDIRPFRCVTKGIQGPEFVK